MSDHAPESKPIVRLYDVTLRWNMHDPNEGECMQRLWAIDKDAAVRQCAEAMWEFLVERDGLLPSGRAEFIRLKLRDHWPTRVAVLVIDSVRREVGDLLAGPADALTEQARMDFDRVLEILKPYIERES